MLRAAQKHDTDPKSASSKKKRKDRIPKSCTKTACDVLREVLSKNAKTEGYNMTKRLNNTVMSIYEIPDSSKGRICANLSGKSQVSCSFSGNCLVIQLLICIQDDIVKQWRQTSERDRD